MNTQHLSPEFTSELDTSREWVTLIRKLRWIGLDDEAERLQVALKALHRPDNDSVLADPRGTD